MMQNYGIKVEMRTRYLAMGLGLILVVSSLLVARVYPVLAQNYRFAVDEMNMQVFVQPDASARIVYDITFTNSGRPIDIVDIGLPHDDYDIDNMIASLDGVPLDDIRVSEFVDTGVEIHLSGQRILSSETGTLHFEATMPNMVFQDVTRDDLASLQITPTWFGNEFVTGDTNLQIAIHMPPGVTPEEILFQNEPFTNKATFQARTVALWQFPNTRLTGPHEVGVSFPKRGLERVVSMNVLQLGFIWYEENPSVQLLVSGLSLILFSILFFRFSGGTGVSLWVVLTVGLGYLFYISPAAQLVSLPLIIALFLINEGRMRSRKERYMPAIAQVEGGGIKRGLTAPEAAAILEMQLNKVLTLIIFGLLKKGVLQQVKATPLTVEVAEDFQAMGKVAGPDKRYTLRRKAAQRHGVLLHKYEQEFLDELEKKPGNAVQDINLSIPMRHFLAHVAGRVSGFDLSDTQDYYRKMVKRVMAEAEATGIVAEREKQLDRDLEWILMSDEPTPVFRSGPNPYRPVWVRPVVSAGSADAAPTIRPTSPDTAPSFSDVAGGFAGWAENTMGGMAASILPDRLQIESAGGKAIDLSGFDQVTGDIFEALASGSGGSGGSSGGCACAGCACACACAGGGR